MYSYHVHDMAHALAGTSWGHQYDTNLHFGRRDPVKHRERARLLAARFRTHTSLHPGPVVVRSHVRAGHVVQGYTRSAR